jgi:glycosyltransferase involved in cell wall biosynthesis
MRVLHLIPSIKAAYGGPATAAFDQIEILKSFGHNSEVVTMDVSLNKADTRSNIRIHTLGERETNFGYSRKLSPWIEENAHRFDVAIIHGIWTYLSAWGSKFLLSNQLPYVIFPHGMMDPYFKKEKPFKHMLKQVFWIFQGRALKNAHSVLFTNETERQMAEGVFIGPKYTAKIVPLGVSEPPKINENSAGALFRKNVPELQNSPYLLFLSRIHPKKGVEILIDAFTTIAHNFPTLHLVIAGPAEPEYLKKLQHQASRSNNGTRVLFVGPLVGDIKWSAYNGADAFCLWTHQENFGIVLIEAMSSSTPVLTTNKTNIWDRLEVSGGAIIGEDTPSSAIDVLNNFLSLSPKEKLALGQNARRGYEQTFTVKAAGRALEHTLLEITGEKDV